MARVNARPVAPTALKAHRFELVEVGETFGPRELIIDEARIRSFAFAQDDYHPWHFAGSPFGGPVGHASILANELMQVYFERYAIDVHEQGGGVWLEEAHVEESLWFAAPVLVGETVSVGGRFVEKYVRGGRGAVVLEGEARGQDGRLLVGHRAIEYFAMDGPREDTGADCEEVPMRRVASRPETRIEPARSARADLAPGTPLAGLEKTITFPQQLVFSTLEHPSARRSVHTDHEIARRAGLSAPLVQGQQLACHIAEAMSRFFGGPWFTSGRLRVKFLAGVCAGERVRIGGAVHGAAMRVDREVLELDVWITNGAGAIVAVANASAPVLAEGETGEDQLGIAYLPTGW